jgi:hypothetical protein
MKLIESRGKAKTVMEHKCNLYRCEIITGILYSTGLMVGLAQ